MSYVRVSSAIPTLEELQKGGTWAIIGNDGVEYEEPFTSDNIVENGNLIVGVDGYFLVAKEDNVQYIEGTDINVVLPKAGTYFIYFGADGYMSKLSVTDYTGFTKPILKMESLTLHQHDWYGKTVVGGNTVRGDETLQGKWVKVSDEVPTEAEINNGGVVRYYNVTDDVISDELITGYYPSDEYGVTVKDEGITIRYGVEVLVIISFNGSSSIGGVTFEGIDSPGIYFKQVGQSCVHSFTINGYTKFSYNVEKIPFELIPEGIGGGVTSWNDLTDKPFGEVNDYILNETVLEWVNNDGMYMALLPVIEPFNGEVYKINLGGIEYQAECTVAEYGFMMGNKIVMGEEDSGEPFFILSEEGMCVIIDLSGNPPSTISIYGKCIKYIENNNLAPLPIIDLTSIGNITNSNKDSTEHTPIDIAVLNDNASRGMVQIKIKLDITYNNIIGSMGINTGGEVYILPAIITRQNSGFILTAILESSVIIHINIVSKEYVSFIAKQITFA